MSVTCELDYNDDRDTDLHISIGDDAGRPIVQRSVERYLAEFDFTDVTFDIKTVFGPGGGAAVIDFTAPTQERMDAFVLLYCGGDKEQADYLLGHTD